MKEISNIEQKKILFLISSIGGGGAERVACRLVSEFSKRYKVYLMYFNKNMYLIVSAYEINSKGYNLFPILDLFTSFDNKLQ